MIASVLAPNIASNEHRLPQTAGIISVRELDWTVPPDNWNWDHPTTIASASALAQSSAPADPSSTLQHSKSSSATSADVNERPYPRLGPPFSAILSADTLYEPTLVTPLLRTLHFAASRSPIPSTTTTPRSAPVYLCVERRDPAVIDAALDEAVNVWGFTLERVPRRKLSKALERGGFVGWKGEDWEGMEVWKLVLKGEAFVKAQSAIK